MAELTSLSDRVSQLTGALLGKWQNVMDIVAELLTVPAALIMRCQGNEIEVLVASTSPGNPYHPGEKEPLPGSGLYCETVIKTRRMLLVPNALEDEKWRNNPDIKLGMISYLGYPIFLPHGEVFGTICVLDIKGNTYSVTYKKLLLRFKELIEAHLELLHTNCLLQDALIQVKILQGLLSICAHCKKIRDDQGYWQQLEAYISQRSAAKFSHGVCPDCLQEHYSELI
ncbi:MAG: GAF domain-containing protein [Desulfobacterales bacterium]|nr:GAF domain-containing protein [Pseudomonadota bacterium]MBU4356119.1 GAF domain-containing protein [Pseudomonadota bacterium]MCG2770653.1 GAF domain-containing protein [Desulfobacterales bacterium]